MWQGEMYCSMAREMHCCVAGGMLQCGRVKCIAAWQGKCIAVGRGYCCGAMTDCLKALGEDMSCQGGSSNMPLLLCAPHM